MSFDDRLFDARLPRPGFTNLLGKWFSRYLSDPQLVSMMLLGGLSLLLFVGQLVTPVWASVVIAYLFGSPVAALER